MMFPEWIDFLLIRPFRAFSDPVLGYWFGSLVAAIVAFSLSKATLAIATFINRKRIDEAWRTVTKRHELSMKALKQKDKKSYKAINELGNEEFGKAFFLQMAMNMGSLWPVFFIAAWFDTRFSAIRFELPFVQFSVSHLAPFVVCFIACFVVASRIKRLYAQPEISQASITNRAC